MTAASRPLFMWSLTCHERIGKIAAFIWPVLEFNYYSSLRLSSPNSFSTVGNLISYKYMLSFEPWHSIEWLVNFMIFSISWTIFFHLLYPELNRKSKHIGVPPRWLFVPQELCSRVRKHGNRDREDLNCVQCLQDPARGILLFS